LGQIKKISYSNILKNLRIDGQQKISKIPVVVRQLADHYGAGANSRIVWLPIFSRLFFVFRLLKSGFLLK